MDKVIEILQKHGYEINKIRQQRDMDPKESTCTIKKSYFVPNILEQEEDLRTKIREDMMKIETLLPNCKITWEEIKMQKFDQSISDFVTFKYINVPKFIRSNK